MYAVARLHIKQHTTNVRQARSHINWRRGQDEEKLIREIGAERFVGVRDGD